MLKNFFAATALLAGLLFTPGAFADYRFAPTSGHLYNLSGQTITKWTVTGECRFTPVGFEQSPRPCGRARAKVSVAKDGSFVIAAFRIPEQHPAFGRVSFTLRHEITAADGTHASLETYDTGGRLEDQVRTLTLWGINPRDLTFRQRDGSSAEAYFHALGDRYLLATLLVTDARTGGTLIWIQNTVTQAHGKFPTERESPEVLTGHLALGVGAPSADLRAVAEFKVENPYLTGPARRLFTKKAELTFSPDLMKSLVGSAVNLDIP